MTINDVSEPIYSVTGLLAHPRVALVEASTADVITPSHNGRVVFRLEYSDKDREDMPSELSDAYGREYGVTPGPRAPARLARDSHRSWLVGSRDRA